MVPLCDSVRVFPVVEIIGPTYVACLQLYLKVTQFIRLLTKVFPTSELYKVNNLKIVFYITFAMLL